jgi:secondary thiamine-phosphate synthase enzyme
MNIVRQRLVLATSAPIEIIDITEQVQALVAASGIRDGLLTLVSPHTTARINLNEREEMLQRDMVAFLERLAPKGVGYLHDLAPVDDRPNGHAHLLGLFMNAGETIPIMDGRLMLGGWQSLFFIELDGPRAERQVDIQIIGEGPPTKARDETGHGPKVIP